MVGCALSHTSNCTGGGADLPKHPAGTLSGATHIQSTKSWHSRLSVDNSLSTHAFIKTSVYFLVVVVGALYGLGRGFTWVAENLTKNSVAATLILHKISVPLYCINVSLCVRENHTSLFS